MDDHALLREYLEHHSEKAFSELVVRHLPLVYGTALRLAGDSHTAQDVAQAVFIQLARKAWTIRDGHALPGWLYRATRHAACAALRGEIRRRARETAAMNLAEQNRPSASIAEQIAPLLDEALGCLSRVEQDALLLRYFQDKSFREVGAALGLNEDAARKRTDRALDKIRLHFSRHGITATAALLGSALTTHAAMRLPAGFAAKVAGTSFASANDAGSLAHSFARILFMSTKTKIAVTTIIVLLIAIISLYMGWQKSDELPQLRALQSSANSPAVIAINPSARSVTLGQVRSSSVEAPLLPPVPASESTPMTPTAAILAPPVAVGDFSQTSRGKAVFNNLRTLAEAARSYMRHTGAVTASYDDLVGTNTDSYISSISPIMGEDYTSFHMSQADTQVQISTPDGSVVTYNL